MAQSDYSDEEEQGRNAKGKMSYESEIRRIYSAMNHAAIRGSRNITTDDVIFHIRHDHEKVSRLKTFLSYKEAKKGVRKPQQAIDEKKDIDALSETAETTRQRKKNGFSWDIISHYSHVFEFGDDNISDIYHDRAFMDKEVRLKLADNITKTMTRGEYVCYSECRQASFIYRKLDRFKRWCETNANRDPGTHSDVMDVLGFFVYDMVAKLTKMALLIKYQWENHNYFPPKQRKNEEEEICILSKMPCKRIPLSKEHIHEAYRRLQFHSEFSIQFKPSDTRKGMYFL